jgi:2-polyprenyl-3-methyl-5-hydroxy-6-metoxy-1,4-benzoquinol methylase
MGEMENASFRVEQDWQLDRYLQWVQDEGNLEGPIQLTTYFQRHQLHRLRWIRQVASGPKILDVGCNWGFSTTAIGAHHGIDINPRNIALAKVLNRDATFKEGDARKIGFKDGAFTSVVMSEVLEHLSWPDEVRIAVLEGIRVATHRLVLTVPNLPGDAECFKHQWRPVQRIIDEILGLELPKGWSFKGYREPEEGFWRLIAASR